MGRPIEVDEVVPSVADRDGTPSPGGGDVAAGAVNGSIVVHDDVARQGIEVRDVVLLLVALDVG